MPHEFGVCTGDQLQSPVLDRALALHMCGLYNARVRTLLTKLLALLLLLLVIFICVAPQVNLPWSVVTGDHAAPALFLACAAILLGLGALTLPDFRLAQKPLLTSILAPRTPPSELGLPIYLCSQRC